MKKVIRLTESDLMRIVKRVIKEQSNLLTESLPILGTNVSVVPINWNDPKVGKYSGQIKVEYNGRVKYYKLKVDTALYDGPVLIKNLWKSGDDYGVKDSKGKTFPISANEMNQIIGKIKQDLSTFTIKGNVVDLTVTKTA